MEFPNKSGDGMHKLNSISGVIFITCLALATWLSGGPGPTPVLAAQEQGSSEPEGYAGSVSCRECHERFYQLWSTSMHGLAMQPYTAEFARTQLTAQQKDVVIGKTRYRAEIGKGQGWVTETGPAGKKKYQIEHVLGGKNVYYFLTPFERGRLQTLPVAYDVHKKEWFDTAASGMRHFPGGAAGEQVGWKDSAYTFNTSCYSCHVSQLSTNYDLKTDTYHTTWAEPGINCETCHGPSAEHNRIFREAPKGPKPEDIRIISCKNFSPEQKNAAAPSATRRCRRSPPPLRRGTASSTTSIW